MPPTCAGHKLRNSKMVILNIKVKVTQTNSDRMQMSHLYG